MKISDIPVPEVYKESADFRFFLNWFSTSLSKVKYDTDNMIDLLDPQRCPSELLWMLADTMGYKYDSRLCTAFNRIVLLYFMSMIRKKGSKIGVTLAAEVNLAQFSINNYGKEKEILYDRLEDTSIPVNSVHVTPHTKEGYIDIVYFSTEKPIDACIEYVRPLGMYLFEYAGVRFDSRTKISIDARLTNTDEVGVSIGSTHVGHYSRSDYASLQQAGVVESYDAQTGKVKRRDQIASENNRRNSVWYRNSDSEGDPGSLLDPGWRTLYSLQLCNNEHIVKSLIPESDTIFQLGYGPQPEGVEVTTHDDYLKPYNLQYNRSNEESLGTDIYTVDAERTEGVLNPRPAVNPIMTNMGDAMHDTIGQS